MQITPAAPRDVVLMIESCITLYTYMYTYTYICMYMYYTTRIPILSVYEVYLGHEGRFYHQQYYLGGGALKGPIFVLGRLRSSVILTIA